MDATDTQHSRADRESGVQRPFDLPWCAYRAVHDGTDNRCELWHRLMHWTSGV